MTTNTATRIGTSNLVPAPQPFAPADANGDVKIPIAVPAPTHSSLRPPLPPTSTLIMPASSLSASVSQLTSVPSASGSATPHSSQSRRQPPPVQEHRACNCRNSKCLKLYCECFASGRYCNSCNCSNCMNNKEHEAARSKAIETILERNPNAFRPKIQYQQGEDGAVTTQVTRHSKGCSCRKSNCLKKYCECFQAGICCAPTCRCKDCKNFEGSEQLMAVMRREDLESQRSGTTVPDSKRARVQVRMPAPPPSSTANAQQAQLAQQPKRDPARDAINNSREKRMHEVVASMLTTLHAEALSKEQVRRGDSEDAEQQPPGGNIKPDTNKPSETNSSLSDYYIQTEGILLGEFGSFLGTLADRIDDQLKRSD